MVERNVPQRSGRIRGHTVAPSNQAARLMVEEMHRPPAQKGKRRTVREATADATARARRLNIRFKPAQMGSAGRVPLASPSTRRANLSSAKRKREARRGKSRKK